MRYCTAQCLKEKIEELEKQGYKLDKIGVSIQRIEDSYFEVGNWTTESYPNSTHGQFTSEAIQAFAACHYTKSDGSIEIVIEAHY